MAKKAITAVAFLSSLFAIGCAPWSNNQSPQYVTVAADTNRDVKKARRDYTAGRSLMEKHLQGKECDFAKAEQFLRASLAADVRFGPAHHSLGVLYFWQKKLYLAAWEFEYAARLMPDRFEPLNNLGLVYESAGKFEQAKVFYLMAREQAPNHADVIANLARAAYRSGETVDQMRPVLEDVLVIDPRPEWRRWAAELLGTNPPAGPELSSALLPSSLSAQPTLTVLENGDNAVQPLEEELPLLPPPTPEPEPMQRYFDEALLLP